VTWAARPSRSAPNSGSRTGSTSSPYSPPIDDGELKSSHRRRRRHADAALSQVVHADVHIFRKPAGTSEAARQRRSQGCREPKGDSAPPAWGAKTGLTLQEFTILHAEREF
jgi:hypothetical protein